MKADEIHIEDRVESIVNSRHVLKEAHDLAAKGGYGFMGSSGMLPYRERLRRALQMLRRNRRINNV